MELVKHVKEWWQQVPLASQAFISSQLSGHYPGLPIEVFEGKMEAMDVIFRMTEMFNHISPIGYCTSLAACVDYILRDYADLDKFLDIINFEKKMEADLLKMGSIESAGHHRERIDNAPNEFEEHQQTVNSWEELKSLYLNQPYYEQYSIYLFQQSHQRFVNGLLRGLNGLL